MWLIVALIIGSGVTALVFSLRNRDIAVKWYDWLIGAVGVLLLLAAVQNYIGSMAELYPTAGWLGLLIFGVPGLILLALTWQLVARRQRAG